MVLNDHKCIPETKTSHPNDPIPHEPQDNGAELKVALNQHLLPPNKFSQFSSESQSASDNTSDSEAPSTPSTEPPPLDGTNAITKISDAVEKVSLQRPRRPSTALVTHNSEEIRKLLGDGETTTKLIEKYCCGGGCRKAKPITKNAQGLETVSLNLPDNQAFRSLGLNLGSLSLETELTNVPELPSPTVTFSKIMDAKTQDGPVNTIDPPKFLQPHPPYQIFSAPVAHARVLTKYGAEKRTYHFDIDVTDYPEEGGVDFKVGGAIGVCPPNADGMVNDIFDRLGIPKYLRDRTVTMKTAGGRWPTIWGSEEARTLLTTRRELFTWCLDVQSSAPTKKLLRVLAEFADADNEKKILLYLTSAEGQSAFCDLRTGPHITLSQLLHAFPSSNPPLPLLITVLGQLMPRFYSLSNDPYVSSQREGVSGRKFIEFAVSIHETPDWQDGKRTGVCSGYLERVAETFQNDQLGSSSSSSPSSLPSSTSHDAPVLHIPMFRGLMANPLSRDYVTSGPMMLIGAGVGMAPFRGFILNRLRNANCANKIWLLQGVRDSSLDELYSGELGIHENKIKHVVQSQRKNKAPSPSSASSSSSSPSSIAKKYVQDEVRAQADVVWFVINAVDGRIFVCGSSKGMGEGVEKALIDVAIDKGNLNHEAAKEFWAKKEESKQYITETW